jgi:hypothetical protein
MPIQGHESAATNTQLKPEHIEALQSMYEDLSPEARCAAVAEETSIGLVIKAVLRTINESSEVPVALRRPGEIQAERIKAATQDAMQAAA